MKYIAISELSKYIGETVTLHGWVHALRDQKHVQFLISFTSPPIHHSKFSLFRPMPGLIHRRFNQAIAQFEL